MALSGGGRSSCNAEGDGRKTKKVSGRWETVVFTYKNHFERKSVWEIEHLVFHVTKDPQIEVEMKSFFLVFFMSL